MRAKYILSIVAVGFLIFFLSIKSSGAGHLFTRQITVSSGEVKVFFNNKQVLTQMPFMVDEKGVALIPVRETFQALGGNVVWDKKNNALYIEGIGKPDADAVRAVQTSFTWLEEMVVIRNVGHFYQQPEKNYMVAAGAHSHGIAVELEENQVAEVVVRTNRKYKGIEGWLGVEDSSMNSSGAYVLSIYADKNIVYESSAIAPATYPMYITLGESNIFGAQTVKFQVKWVDSGSIGTSKELIAVLADFKFKQ
ncbi:MAG: NPCBM/NEW2 domain-containing protein [Desulfitobacteriaceae bacterium]|nr:NPCBM/NEW2 domain-containing protein [Desulfitobacteriaceae bacterium]MDD4752325.1 NPCBM/NEW2 domain-containing protein [Desulfitobacteriaceae bacterium]